MAVRLETVSAPVCGMHEIAVAVCMSEAAPETVLFEGVMHRYRTAVDAELFVMTCDEFEASPVKLGAVIAPVHVTFGTRSVAPPVSPGVYVIAVAVLRLDAAAVGLSVSEKVIY